MIKLFQRRRSFLITVICFAIVGRIIFFGGGNNNNSKSIQQLQLQAIQNADNALQYRAVNNNNNKTIIAHTINSSIATIAGATTEKEEEEVISQSLLPPCQIMVKNLYKSHYEVMESVAKQYPLKYLQLPANCDHRNLIFDFVTEIDRIGRGPNFLKYMNEHIINTTSATVIDYSLPSLSNENENENNNNNNNNNNQQKVVVKRTIRAAKLKKGLKVYDAIIQNSCYCHSTRGLYFTDWLNQSQYKMCIFHERCDKFLNLTRAMWVSPHFPRHFIPTSLPQPPPARPSLPTPAAGGFRLCSIGSSKRRYFKPLALFLQKNYENSDLMNKLTILLLGKGITIPKDLQPFQKYVTFKILSPQDDWKFAMQVKTCDVIMLLIKKSEPNNCNYFVSSGNCTSKSKLSGTIPQIIAYNKSFIMPNEIVNLYKDYLPLNIPHAGYDDDDDETFVNAFSSLLTKLEEEREKKMNHS